MLNRNNIHYYLYLNLLGLLIGLGNAVAETEEPVNPHWTDKHCTECHVKAEKPDLLFEGDSVQMCNRCHAESFARTDIHPVGVKPTADMQKIMPDTWPLENGAITCITCHDVLVQMKENAAQRLLNPSFLRGAPYEQISSFCFSCHQQNQFAKTNPHEQLDAQGTIIAGRCLFCHQSLPNPQQAQSINDVTFNNGRTDMCVNCHSDKQTAHPARADHLVELSADRLTSLQFEGGKQGIELPIFRGSVVCGTCHNPHQKGVMHRQEIGHGAGTENFLRLNGGYALCVFCHTDMRITAKRSFSRPSRNALKTAPEVMRNHKPWAENKCKMCHTITPKNRTKPAAVLLCFKQGCHQTDMLEKEFVHAKSVGENCYFCHESHNAGYKKLLRINEKRLCYTCHPLIQNENMSESVQPASKWHDEYLAYIQTTDIPQERACEFCHSSSHQKEISTIKTGSCADCHIYVRQRLAEAAIQPINSHQQFEKQSCSACHDPHAAAYPFQLKNPVETYTQ